MSATIPSDTSIHFSLLPECTVSARSERPLPSRGEAPAPHQYANRQAKAAPSSVEKKGLPWGGGREREKEEGGIPLFLSLYCILHGTPLMAFFLRPWSGMAAGSASDQLHHRTVRDGRDWIRFSAFPYNFLLSYPLAFSQQSKNNWLWPLGENILFW